MADEKTAIIIVAAGRGERAGGDVPKQWRLLGGMPVLQRTLAAFADFARVVVVVHADEMMRALALTEGRVTLIAGGANRQQSVRNALEALEGSGVDCVLIHDGARPFVSKALIRRVEQALTRNDAAAPALLISDALWRGERGVVTGMQPRAGLFRAQTPQGFAFPAILVAHRAYAGAAADDVEVARAAGMSVAIVEGEDENIKITLPDDFARGERLLGAKMDVRVGNGYDVHAFGKGDHVMLCGVKVAHKAGLVGHSDADVGMHALSDAIYGALAQGDIGRHFPPSDPQWKGAPSRVFLEHAAGLVAQNGFRLANADVTLVCEHPKITPHAPAMMAELARILGVDAGRVSVKATTSEKLGFTGREEGIAALATVALVSA